MKVYMYACIGGLGLLTSCLDKEGESENTTGENDDNSMYCNDDPEALPRSEDFDCDGTLAEEDCNDNDSESTIRAEDADCDGVLTEEDCDDTNPDTINDMDCDGAPGFFDCDDTDPNSTTQANDADCDGVPTDEDCDDGNADVQTNSLMDADCDGTLTEDDCNDNDSESTIRAEDADCDGVPTDEDCDDSDFLIVNSNLDDGDCDGVLTLLDCDDTDANLLAVTDDYDCDGVPTVEDCDDTDPNSTTQTNDADCDGVPTAEDCDDADSENITSIQNDGDCDGVPTAEDCDDNDPTNVNNILIDVDCDGTIDTLSLPPIADAGEDMLQEYDCTLIHLDGLESSDVNGATLEYLWSVHAKPSNSNADDTSFSDPFSGEPDFYPDVAGDYELALRVWNGTMWSLPDFISITANERVSNTAPVVQGGYPVSVDAGTTSCEMSGYTYSCGDCADVTVDLGLAAYIIDAENDALSYQWNVVSGDAMVADDEQLQTTVTLSGSTVDTIDSCDTSIYELELQVTDCPGATSTDSVLISVTCCGEEL